MLTLRLTFPWGRYYAHPWGQNPARITEAEWPPSPWRLLRAIAAAWFQSNPGREPTAELVQTLEILGRELPAFALPKVSFSRAIHYQPNYGITPKEDAAQARYKRVRHENHFVAVGGDVLVRWQLSGTDGATRATALGLLRDVAGRITYFGRADSVCELQVEESSDEGSDAARVALLDGKPCRQINPACRDVFCPNPADFQASDLWIRRADGASGTSARKHLVQDLLDAPQPMPDGAAWYSYRMPNGWPEQWVVRHPRPAQRRPRSGRTIAKCLEFSLQCRIPVPAKFVVSIAELFRNRAISLHGDPSFSLSGHDRPDDLQIAHQHAFYLPRLDEKRQDIDRLIVWCPYGFTQREVNALMAVGALRWADARFPARPVLLQVQRELPPLRTSRVWESVTPFVPPRYWYRKKIAEGRMRAGDTPENQLRQSLLENGVDAACASIHRMRASNAEWDICKVHLPKQAQAHLSEPDRRVGLFFRIEFADPVALPFPSFGHSSHFGLGQFDPADS